VDMHRENLIAAGAFPVLVDLEALWHPQEHAGAMDHRLATSVLRTGFLPQIDPQIGVVYEWNALSHRLNPNSRTTFWTSVNEDHMMLKRGNRPCRDSHHLPAFSGTVYLAGHFLPEILEGFHWIGERVLEGHSNRKKFQRWVEILRQCPRRRIFRSSMWYRTALEQLTAPVSLRKGGIVSTDVAQLILDGGPLIEAEWKALMELDVPWLEQAAVEKDDYTTLLPIQTMEELLAQKALIANALASLANKDR